MHKLTIVMPFLNEKQEPIETIKSINSTTNPNNVEIIAIDDNSKERTNFSQFNNVKVIINKERMGVDSCRNLGVSLSKTDEILIIDAHMRFKNDNWVDKMLNYIKNNPNTIWCTTCLGLGYGTMDINRHKGKYYGANMLFFDKNARPDRPARECLEPKWASEQLNQEYEIACVLGANYFFSKKWFDYIHGLNGLKSWGSSEPFLSIKSFLSGGNSMITKEIEIGHYFRENAPYTTNISDLCYNKHLICKTIMPLEIEEKIIECLPKDINTKKAMEFIEKEKEFIKEERKYYDSIFKRDIYEYCKKYNVEI